MSIREMRSRAYQSQLPKSTLLVYIFLLDCLKTKEQKVIYIQRREICKACHIEFRAVDTALRNLKNERFINKEIFNEDIRTCLKITIL